MKDLEVEAVLENVFASDVFSPDDRDEIKSKSTRKEQCKTFLDMLTRRGAEAYDIFINALAKGNQAFLVKVIQEEGKIVHCLFSILTYIKIQLMLVLRLRIQLGWNLVKKKRQNVIILSSKENSCLNSLKLWKHDLDLAKCST